MPEPVNAIDLLVDDHREIEDLFGQYENASEADARTRIVHRVVHQLAVHGEIEELLLYPRLRTALKDGNQLADHAVAEHVEIKQTLNELDRMRGEDDGFDERMQRLMAEVRHHVEEEEGELFPRVRDAIPPEQLLRLGASLRSVKVLVPTRPHPMAPTGPVGKLVTSAPVALVDRVRDAIRAWRDESSGAS